jgi:drug/metabolite transporter (DMT)-like permease
MSLWLILALGSALTNSLYNAASNYLVSKNRWSKFTLIYWLSLMAAFFLFFVNLYIGFPEIDNRFWFAILTTAIINAFTGPLLLRAYELGEFSSVYSMVLLTPVFTLITSKFLVAETPSAWGVLGVLATVIGLYIILRNHTDNLSESKPNFMRANMIGISVAFLWSITTNFDKLSSRYSNAFFAPFVGLLIIAAINALFVFIMRERHLPTVGNAGKLQIKDYLIFLGVGAFFAMSNVLHNAALMIGFVSYTLAIKRVGILFAIIWGWLFFKEKNLRKKLLGAAVAVAGVMMILFA